MGGIAHLSRLLPLNWHVRSTASIARYTLTHAGVTREGGGLAHIEKNWGSSFPRGWIWSQSLALDAGKTLCLAGGTALPGIHAYLVGYRSPACTWDFRPPFAVAVGHIAPFMRVRHDSVAGTVDLRVQTWTRKLVVKMQAPVDSFVGLPAPLKNGHKPEYAFESFAASTWISAWHRRWPFGKWILVEKGPCGQTAEGGPCAALEFGGSFSHRVGK
ncbi:hypothetical protein A0H81_02106 [Grifola frondosa]|uniref:Uncharacterized protein n=1 Tax=Grifola frondosa TaxID=5627 RepID=A0A1C7MK27_GRIFR|nr:hypothetical protein A0H81_02106 [Grifola frondosa]